jgi:hypothetical protein
MAHKWTQVSNNFYKKITLCVLLIANIFIPLGATSNANKAEIGAAITTMLVDMAANHYAFKGNTKIANFFKCATDILSLSTRCLFFYNNKHATDDTGEWNPCERDCLANGAFMLRDVTKLAEHLYASITTEQIADLQEIDAETLTAALRQEKLSPEADIKALKAFLVQKQLDHPNNKNYHLLTPEQKITYNFKVFFNPLFKGLTALTIACTQRYATTLSGDQSRFTAAAMHSFALLLEEYSNLRDDSLLQKPLLFALCLNVAWAIFEGNKSFKEGAALAAQKGESRTTHGNTVTERFLTINCPACGAGSRAIQLDCDHGHCIRCRNHELQTKLQANDTDQFHYLFCSEDCKIHPLSRTAIEGITNNDPDIMHAYDVAKFRNAPRADLIPHYAILEIDATATAKVVDGAFRRIIRRHHPDKRPVDPIASARIFQQLINARKTILQHLGADTLIEGTNE